MGMIIKIRRKRSKVLLRWLKLTLRAAQKSARTKNLRHPAKKEIQVANHQIRTRLIRHLKTINQKQTLTIVEIKTTKTMKKKKIQMMKKKTKVKKIKKRTKMKKKEVKRIKRVVKKAKKIKARKIRMIRTRMMIKMIKVRIAVQPALKNLTTTATHQLTRHLHHPNHLMMENNLTTMTTRIQKRRNWRRRMQRGRHSAPRLPHTIRLKTKPFRRSRKSTNSLRS